MPVGGGVGGERVVLEHARQERLLAEAAADFSSAGPVNHVMGKVFHALAADRISTRKAGVLCYIAQTILHSHRAMALKKKLDAEAAARKAAEEEKAMRPDKLT